MRNLPWLTRQPAAEFEKVFPELKDKDPNVRKAAKKLVGDVVEKNTDLVLQLWNPQSARADSTIDEIKKRVMNDKKLSESLKKIRK